MPITINDLQFDNHLARECEKAKLILEHAHDAAKALGRAHDAERASRGNQRASRGNPRGVGSDEEQDILRSMLIMAGAGIDASLKQLIKDSLVSLLSDAKVNEEFKKFVERNLKGDENSSFSTYGAKFLADIIVSDHIKERLIEKYIDSLTGNSLQSVEELSKVINALGVDVQIDRQKLSNIFQIRNKIIHELDINLNASRRNRNTRTFSSMQDATNELLKTAQDIINAVSHKVQNP